MELLRFFLAHADLPRRKLICYSALAGAANVLAIAFLNSAAANAEDQATEIFILALFSVDILIYLAAQKFIWHVSTREVENVVNDIRMKLVKKISGCDLESLEKMGRSDIFAAINQHSNVIALSGLPIIISIQSFILLFFTLLYVAYLSLAAFVLIAIFLGVAIFAAMNRSTEAEKLMDVAVKKERAAYSAITDILQGFKEVKLNSDREIGLKQHTENMSLDARDARIFANRKLASNYIATQTSYYLTIAALIFILPMVVMSTDNLAEAIVKVVTACIFLVSPINTIVSVLPSYTSATASLHFINEMNKKLDDGQEAKQATLREFPPLESLELKEVCFAFDNKGNEPGFQIGPINLKLEANEIVFFTGGNGSGKTTLIKALIGLYRIKSGAILYNGELVNHQDLASYRNLFTAIFTDFHLFKRFYGMHVDEQEATELLKLFQLEHKTSFADGEFITQDLSTGQRKRLALIVSILENRPIMILDEWAADQDPTFRAIFYQQLLPRLKAQGRTILAISHDEQYFDCADERYHIVEGQLANKPELSKGES